MKTKYIDLISQTFDWPQSEFEIGKDGLEFHGIPLMSMVEKYGTPLKFNYIPAIGMNIGRVREWFKEAFAEHNYQADYHYCYVTKSSHFPFVIKEVLANDAYLESSSGFDLAIFKKLFHEGLLKQGTQVICNGYKDDRYLKAMKALDSAGFKGMVPVIDNVLEFDLIDAVFEDIQDVGIRIASEEEPKFEFYTSRLGIRYKDILQFYKQKLASSEKLRLRMLHFFVNTGIRDSAYYWNELHKCLQVYVDLKKVCPTLDSLNIGGGFPIKNSLAFEYDYQYMVSAIVAFVKQVCEENGIPEPHLYTEFGSFTVGESGGAIYSVINQKQQNDREKWDMIDSSFMTTLPDVWAISKRFVMLPVNRWEEEYERVFLGGLTCDSDDYYNSEQHINAIYLPKYNKNKKLYIGFFNTGAYQESLSGFGGVHHCLIPQPKHILVNKNEQGEITFELFKGEQTADDVLNLLGY